MPPVIPIRADGDLDHLCLMHLLATFGANLIYHQALGAIRKVGLRASVGVSSSPPHALQWYMIGFQCVSYR
jgi:hypothetical protein